MLVKVDNCFQCNAPIFKEISKLLGERETVHTCNCHHLAECCQDERHYRVEWWDKSHFEGFPQGRSLKI